MDFMRVVRECLPGLDTNQLLNQLDNNPTQLQIPVPPGMNPDDQSKLQKTLEQALKEKMNTYNNLQQSWSQLLQQPQQQPPQQQRYSNPPIVSAAMINNLVNQHPFQQAPPQPLPKPPPVPSEDDMALQDAAADANHDEEYHEVETYSDYSPAKLDFGLQHPDPVVETSSLSTVEPPDITYKPKLPAKVIENGLLSALQLESVIYTSQQHAQYLPDGKTRKGFLIGDGAGVGKGRTIAGIIYENYLCGRKKAIWFSVCTDLKLDAERDLKDVGAKIPVFLLSKYSYGRRINEDHGVIFTTYSGLISKSQSVRGNLGTRLGQLVNWVGPNFDGVIVFDECHKAKNISIGKAKNSKAASHALEIQNKLPNARIVYASATGASEPRHLGYMTRLGIWGNGTAYKDFNEFCSAIEKRGVGAMELVAVDLKMRGAYIARQLSFKTTNFEIKHASLSDDFIKIYDDCVDMWTLALKSFQEAEGYLGKYDKKRIRNAWSCFWGAHQKFFKYLCIGAKVPLVIEIANQALNDGKCVVIGLQSTGEAKTLEMLEEGGDINEFVSTARATFESLIENHFPAPNRGRRRKTPTSEASTDSDIATRGDSNQATISPAGSSSTDDLFLLTSDPPIKFIREDGVVKPVVDETKVKKIELAEQRSEVKDQKKKNLKALQELIHEKKEKPKSSRAERAKRRATTRRAKSSRIKITTDDSDTEISNPLSSCSSDGLLFSPATSGKKEDDDDTTYSENSSAEDDDSSTLTEGGETSEDELAVVGSKAAGKKRNSCDSDDSDSDIQITAIKPKRHHDVIILSSDDDGEEEEEDENDPMVRFGARLNALRDQLFVAIDKIGPQLPSNTLDDLIDRLGGPSKVAEMTGRKGRMVKDNEGQVSYRHRNEEDALEAMNIAEKERFMKGDKLVAIISEAASSGISLQADKRVANTRRRVHITIELPWSADRAIQQFGRTHRSNQLSGPEYVFVISELAGEKRFASIVAKRLESLGALTHGDRRANNESRDLSQFNIDNKFSKMALESIREILLTKTIRDRGIKIDYPAKDFFEHARQAYIGAGLAKHTDYGAFQFEGPALQTNLFLNRILGMRVRIQNAIFKLFTDYIEKIITRRKIAGTYDAGILELNSESGKAECEAAENFNLKTIAGRVPCSLRRVKVERGISWAEALSIFEERGKEDKRCGFYETTDHIFLLLKQPDSIDLFQQYKPNTGRQPKALFHALLVSNASKVSVERAQKRWTYIFELTNDHCVHLTLFKSCKRIEAKMNCDIGLRHRYYCILSGSVLTAWPYLERKVPHATNKIQIVRLRMDAHNRVIGPIIPRDTIDAVRLALKEGEQRVIQFDR